MTRAFCFIFMIFLFSGIFLYAQEEMPPDESPGAPPIESEWEEYNLTVYNRGDKTFTITLGLIIPTVFSGVAEEGHGIGLGGTGTLAFNYFFTPHIFFGGELSGMFAGTRGKNMLYIIPFGLRFGYQFVIRRFEFPISIMVGGAPQRYLEEGYFGLIIKPGASMFWRFNPDWSFGLNAVWWMVPQWPKNGNKALGNFMEITLSARYHF